MSERGTKNKFSASAVSFVEILRFIDAAKTEVFPSHPRARDCWITFLKPSVGCEDERKIVRFGRGDVTLKRNKRNGRTGNFFFAPRQLEYKPKKKKHEITVLLTVFNKT